MSLPEQPLRVYDFAALPSRWQNNV